MSNSPTTNSNSSSTAPSLTPSAELPPVEVTGGLTAQPDSISELFNREPDSWTEEDMTRMIAELRKRRRELDAAPEKKGKKSATPKTKIEAKTGDDLLSVLGLKV